MEKFKLIVIGVASLWLATSCQNEVEFEPHPRSVSPLTIAEAQNWLNDVTSTSGSRLRTKAYVSNGDEEDFSLLEPLFDWNLAEVSNDSLWSVVELPWNYVDAEVVVKSSDVAAYAEENPNVAIPQIQRLVIMRNLSTGDTYGFCMVVLPSLSYWQRTGDAVTEIRYLNRDNAFDGAVLFYSLQGDFVNGWLYQNGIIEGKLQLYSSSSPQQASIQKLHYDYYTIETCVYQKNVNSAGDIVYGPVLLYCKTRIFAELVQDNDQNPWGGGSGTTGGYDTGGGGGGSTPDKPNNPEPDPCQKLGNIKADAGLNARVNSYTEKARVEPIEDGYVKGVDGSFLPPKIRESRKVDYGSSLSGKKWTERLHIHTDVSGGSSEPSWQDLKTLYNMFSKGQMADVSNFKYVVVSSTGTLILTISDPIAFTEFYKNALMLGETGLFWDAFMNTVYQKNDPDEFEPALAQLLDDLNSGLTCTYGKCSEEGTAIDWNTKQVTDGCTVTNIDCN